MHLTHSVAAEIVEGARRSFTDRGVPSAVAVVDVGGNLLAFLAHEEAILAARELAINKAYTALSLRANTEDLGEAVLPGGPFYGLGNTLNGRPLVTFAGGRPLRDQRSGQVIGAVGVSGGTLDDDTAIAAAAVKAYGRAATTQDV